MDPRDGQGVPSGPAPGRREPAEQPERHLAYFAHAPLAVMVADAFGRFVEVNPAACRISGYDEAELLTMSMHDLLADESRELAAALFARVKEVGSISGEVRWIRKDGAKRWSAIDAARLSEDRFIGFFLDVTDRKATEEALRESEHRFRTLTEMSPAGVYLTDASGGCLYVNPRWCEMAGLAPGEALGNGWIHGIHPDDRAGVAEGWYRTASSGDRWGMEYRFQTRDGKITWVWGTAAAVQDEQGIVRGYVGTNLDITELKRTEQVLREREARLRGILNAVSESVFLLNPEGIVLECNETAARRLGRTVEELLGKSVYDCLPPELAVSRSAKRHEVLRSRKPVRFEDQRAGTWFESTVYPVFDDGGAIVELAVFARDISERKRQEEQLQLQSLVLSQIQDRVAITDLMGVITYVNDAICSSLKRSRESLVGQPAAVFGAWTGRGASRHDVFRNTFSDGEWRGEVLHRAADGTESVADCRTIVVKDLSGQPIALCGIATDITQRVRAEEALRQSEEHYRVLAETMLQGVVHQDDRGAIISMNPAAERILGSARDQAIGSSPCRAESGAIHEDGSPFLYEDYPAIVALRTGETVRDVVMGFVHPKTDDYRWLRVDAVPVFRPGANRPYQVYTVFEDITDRRRAEHEAREMERRLFHAQKLESLGLLAGGIAHDFNNILAGIMGYADLLKVRLPPSEPARADLEVIKSAVRRAADLTRQMLAYAGKGKFAVEALDLSRAVEEVRPMLEMSVSKKASLTYDLAADLPAIEADASQIHQVVLNLVTNASEALGEQGGAIAIATGVIELGESDGAAFSLGAELRAGRYVRLEVADTGCGMDAETLAKVFDPFFTTKFTGRGLGLAAVHGIVRGHHGGIRAFSEPGRGTTFCVVFPAGSGPAPAPRAEAASTSWRGSGMVLVVDDEELVRGAASRMIEHAGFSVLTARDGDEAIRLYQEHHDAVVCVLLDLNMPKRSSEEVFRELCKIRPGVRVVLSSGFSEESATERFSGLELAGFIQKPYQLDTMIATLQRALAASEAGESLQRGSHVVLVVEDDAMNRLSTQILFEQAGFSVLTAGDGEEAIAVHEAHREQIACVFLDANLPRKNGEETLRAIRRADSRVLAIVTSGEDPGAVRARFAGMEVLAFVQKPDPLDAAIGRLKAALTPQ